MPVEHDRFGHDFIKWLIRKGENIVGRYEPPGRAVGQFGVNAQHQFAQINHVGHIDAPVAVDVGSEVFVGVAQGLNLKNIEQHQHCVVGGHAVERVVVFAGLNFKNFVLRGAIEQVGAQHQVSVQLPGRHRGAGWHAGRNQPADIFEANALRQPGPSGNRIGQQRKGASPRILHRQPGVQKGGVAGGIAGPYFGKYRRAKIVGREQELAPGRQQGQPGAGAGAAHPQANAGVGRAVVGKTAQELLGQHRSRTVRTAQGCRGVDFWNEQRRDLVRRALRIQARRLR